VPERPPEVLGRLAVGAQLRGPLTGGRGVTEHCVHVAGRVGVVGQARGVDRPVPRARQRGQHVAVKLDPPVRRDRLLDRQPRQLVAELEPAA
jgi:hypothetical protein